MPKKLGALKLKDLLQWRRSEHFARRIVRRYLASMGGEENGHVIAEPEEAMIGEIAHAISRAELEAQARLAVRSAAGSASLRAGQDSATTRARAAASRRRPTTTRRKRVNPH